MHVIRRTPAGQSFLSVLRSKLNADRGDFLPESNSRLPGFVTGLESFTEQTSQDMGRYVDDLQGKFKSEILQGLDHNAVVGSMEDFLSGTQAEPSFQAAAIVMAAADNLGAYQ